MGRVCGIDRMDVGCGPMRQIKRSHTSAGPFGAVLDLAQALDHFSYHASRVLASLDDELIE